jgi:hypothetical protein
VNFKTITGLYVRFVGVGVRQKVCCLGAVNVNWDGRTGTCTLSDDKSFTVWFRIFRQSLQRRIVSYGVELGVVGVLGALMNLDCFAE